MLSVGGKGGERVDWVTDPCQCHSWRTLEVRVWRVGMWVICSETQPGTWRSRRATRRWPVSNDWYGQAPVQATDSHRLRAHLVPWTQSTADHVMTSLSMLPDQADMDLWLRGLMPAHHIVDPLLNIVLHYVFMPSPTTALCSRVIRPVVRPCPRYFRTYYVEERFQWKMPQIFIMWVEIVEKAFKVKGQRWKVKITAWPDALFRQRDNHQLTGRPSVVRPAEAYRSTVCRRADFRSQTVKCHVQHGAWD